MRHHHWAFLTLALAALPATAQQAGALVGTVLAPKGQGLSGVRIEASSSGLPQPRTVISDQDGTFRLPLLPPGLYTLTFTHAGLVTQKRTAHVVLQQNTALRVSMAEAAPGAEVVVSAQATLLDAGSAELKSALTSEVFDTLPVGQGFRDLIKLIPGVPYTQDAVRGPSAGGSGQDNVHLFDGVNVNLPLFGTLSAEPSSLDIDQIAVLKGGAAATDFNRAGGFSINSVSRSGTDAFQGELSYQLVPDQLIARRTNATSSQFELDTSFLTARVGGPLLKERLFFFTSFYRPVTTKENSSNLYGPVPDMRDVREEFFLKLTYAPTNALLFNASYRTSDRVYRHAGVGGPASAASTRTGGKVGLDIGILEGSWLLSPHSYLTFKATDFANKTLDRPDTLFTFRPALDGSVGLDVSALDTQGLFTVPVPNASSPTYNAFIAPLVDRYGYLANNVRNGGGNVGGASQLNTQDFFRRNYQAAFDTTFDAGGLAHELHVGLQWWKETEDLLRTSNGWGAISAPRNVTFNGLPVFFQALVQQQGILSVPTIRSEYASTNVEVNDRIRWRNLTFNVGLLASQDRLYGQGLREKAGTVSGFELAKGHRYLMHQISFREALQPRLGLTWAYRDSDTVYANYARYVPAASSLPRAASWATNSAALINAYFDANGAFMGSSPEASSVGKVFASGLKPRHTDEYLVGTTKDLGRGWTARLHARYRHSTNFWEDTNNDARLRFDPPPGIPRELYVPNLGAIRAEIGGDTYVIAKLDGAFTKYWETGLETEWRGSRAYLRASYVWSHYYGTFDQDNTTVGNDANLFMGASYIADDAGRQIWNFKYGDLTGDRRHQVKVFGSYAFPWMGRLGAFAIYQSGQPWQFQSWEPYAALTGSRADTNRYAEPAGSHRTAPHYQLDLNYTQGFWQRKSVRVEGMLDIYNVFNRQTGYNIQSRMHSALPGTPQTFFAPRRTQLGLRVQF